ncbi:Smr/MutS family protein [Thiolapillus brandeum]|uniref:Smr/MutS family protein n=1 Tax=Thiolapillus brandeum TaxID=1076588 RepID=A0A7U6GJI5_9GAMM|nr:Smr/MutS family protein [Thiolapillus brandeum]BAO44805.1 Smr/MutS family protein [Thiolapillus brandeum]
MNTLQTTPIPDELDSLGYNRFMSGTDNSGDDEFSAFQEAMQGVTPLEHDKASPWKQRKRPVPLEHSPDGSAPGDEFADTSEDTPDFLEFRRPGIQHRLWSDLQRGVLQPEATLDLHGMRVRDARQALAQFLNQSLAGRKRCVRIIHGKGRGSSQQPVLKQRLNQWLPQKKEVLAYCSAPRWDGGTGAAYVLLSRKWG